MTSSDGIASLEVRRPAGRLHCASRHAPGTPV